MAARESTTSRGTMLAQSYGDYEHLLFARGYLFWSPRRAHSALVERLGWEEQRDLPPSWCLAHSQQVEVAVSRSGATTVVLIGGGVVPEIRSATSSEIADWLVQTAEDDDEFQRRADAINGRFVVARMLGEELRIQNDAQGLKAIFHTATSYPPVVGSHANLVAEEAGAPPNAFARADFHKETNLRTPPGRHTTRHGVFAVLANTELSMPSRQVDRIYPRVPRREDSTDALLPAIQHELEVSQQLLVDAQQPVYCSLSAGLDSRLTLAFCRPHVEHIKFFTYDIQAVRNRANEHDAEAAKALATEFHLDHSVIRIAARSAPDDLRRLLAVNRHRAHAPALATGYLDFFPDDAVHLRSNGNETVSGYYRRDGWPADVAVTAEARMQLAAHGRCRDLGALDAFTDAWQASKAWRVESLGHSGLDFAYAEDRMGVWHQNIVQESDISCETRVPFGSRRIIDLLLSCPVEERLTGRVFITLIRSRWPELLQVPINGVDLSQSTDDGLWDPGTAASRTFLVRQDLMA